MLLLAYMKRVILKNVFTDMENKNKLFSDYSKLLDLVASYPGRLNVFTVNLFLNLFNGPLDDNDRLNVQRLFDEGYIDFYLL